MSVNRARDRFVSSPCLVLVDHRCTLAVVTHASHQVLDASPAGRRKRVPGMTQVVEMHVPQSGRLGRVLPAAHPVEVASPQRRTLRTRKHKRGRLWPDKDGQVLTERGNDHLRNTNRSASSPGLQWAKRDLAARRPPIREGSPDPDQPLVQADIRSCQCSHLAPPQTGKGGEQSQRAGCRCRAGHRRRRSQKDRTEPSQPSGRRTRGQAWTPPNRPMWRSGRRADRGRAGCHPRGPSDSRRCRPTGHRPEAQPARDAHPGKPMHCRI